MIVTFQFDTSQSDDFEMLAEMKGFVAKMMGRTSVDTSETAKPEKRGPGRPRKVVEPVAPTEEAAPLTWGQPSAVATVLDAVEYPAVQEPVLDEPVLDEPVAASPALDADSFRALAMAYNKANGVKALLEVLKRHQFGNIGAVTSDMYAVVAADLKR